MSELFVSAFVTLFLVVDPLGCAPIFAGLTSGAPPRHANRIAVKACAVAATILLVFALFGRQLLTALHIELDSFRIAGGIMLFLIALDMVFERRTKRREARAEKVRATPEIEDVSVFPLAIPMIAGPGSIATVMLLMSRAETGGEVLMVLIPLILVLVLALLAFLTARPLMRLLGSNVEDVITRLLGVLLAALAAQYVIDGLRPLLA